MKALTLYRRTVLAVIIPVALSVLGQTPFFRAFCETAWQGGPTRWLLAGCFVVLIAVEVSYLVTLIRFARARWRVDVFSAMAVDPVVVAGRRRWKFRWVAAGLATLGALLLAEAGFRVLKIEPPSTPSDCRDGLPHVDESVNALGIREDWDLLPDDDSRLRVAFLGDSFTFGTSVESEQSLPRQVGRLLADASPNGVVTINMGEIAAAPARELEIYEALHEILQPDVVVQVINVNDFGVHLYKLLDNLYRLRDHRLWLGDTSYLLRYIEKQIRYWIVWNDTLGYYRGGFSAAERADSWHVFEKHVRACKDRVEADGGTYAMVLFPWLYRLDSYQLTDMHDRVAELAGEMDVPYLDLLEVFQGRDGEALRVCPMDTHPNAEAFRLAALRVARFLRDDVMPLSVDPAGQSPQE